MKPSKIRVHDSASMNWQTIRERCPEVYWDQLSKSELDSMQCSHEPGDEQTLQLFETKLLPGSEPHVHAHDEDEIIYVVGGSLIAGARELMPGSSLFVKGRTLYSFMAGPDGLHFLNFRPRADYSYILPDELRALNAKDKRAKDVEK
jgi:hypothetical protein